MEISRYRVVDSLSRVVALWEKCGRDSQSETVHFSDPQWLLECFHEEPRQLEACFVEDDGAILGVAPFAVQAIPLKLRIGPLALGAMGLRRLRLLGGAPNLPDEIGALDALFREMLERPGFDAIWIEALRADSFLWTYLRTSPLIRRHLHLYRARGPVARPYIALRGSFEEYLQRFSRKKRQNIARDRRRLQALSGVEVVRVSSVDQVDSFVTAATEISRTTYQFKRLGLGLRDGDALRRRLRLAANRGWLRAYLQSCGGKPCSFVVGYQFNGRFYYADVGYDPAWSAWGVGTMLLLHIVEDLFTHDRPETLDFGPGGEYKQHFANASYSEVEALLFPRRAYPLTVAAAQRTCDAIGAAARRVTDTLGGKSRLRRWLRGRADRVQEDRPE
jgi:Acetyltransferase (GNAT) domain